MKQNKVFFDIWKNLYGVTVSRFTDLYKLDCVVSNNFLLLGFKVDLNRFGTTSRGSHKFCIGNRTWKSIVNKDSNDAEVRKLFQISVHLSCINSLLYCIIFISDIM